MKLQTPEIKMPNPACLAKLFLLNFVIPKPRSKLTANFLLRAVYLNFVRLINVDKTTVFVITPIDSLLKMFFVREISFIVIF